MNCANCDKQIYHVEFKCSQFNKEGDMCKAACCTMDCLDKHKEECHSVSK